MASGIHASGGAGRVEAHRGEGHVGTGPVAGGRLGHRLVAESTASRRD